MKSTKAQSNRAPYLEGDGIVFYYGPERNNSFSSQGGQNWLDISSLDVGLALAELTSLVMAGNEVVFNLMKSFIGEPFSLAAKTTDDPAKEKSLLIHELRHGGRHGDHCHATSFLINHGQMTVRTSVKSFFHALTEYHPKPAEPFTIFVPEGSEEYGLKLESLSPRIQEEKAA